MNSTAAPAGPQRAHHVEQPGHLGGGQRGGRLVHHDDPGLQRQRLGDLDDLLVGDGQPAADPARVERARRAGSNRAAAVGPHPAPVDAPAGQQRLAAHEDVLGHGQVGEQGRFLVDDRDARRPGRRPGRAGRPGWPSMSSSPASGWCTPARIFTSVDLPAPFSPTSACASPPYRSIVASTTARTAPNDFAACAREHGRPRADGPGAPGGAGLAAVGGLGAAAAAAGCSRSGEPGAAAGRRAARGPAGQARRQRRSGQAGRRRLAVRAGPRTRPDRAGPWRRRQRTARSPVVY